MKASSILSLVSWLNIYALVWMTLLYPPIRENIWNIILAFLLFFAVAAATNSLSQRDPQKEEKSNAGES